VTAFAKLIAQIGSMCRGSPDVGRKDAAYHEDLHGATRLRTVLQGRFAAYEVRQSVTRRVIPGEFTPTQSGSQPTAHIVSAVRFSGTAGDYRRLLDRPHCTLVLRTYAEIGLSEGSSFSLALPR